MNKTFFGKLFLILLPVSAAALAATGDSVTVFNPATWETASGSYFDLIPAAGNLQILPPVAGMLALVATVLSIVYMVRESRGVLKGMIWVALLSASAAAVPIAIRGEMVVVPNVLLPLLMCTQAALAYVVGKLPKEEQGNQGRRLERHG